MGYSVIGTGGGGSTAAFEKYANEAAIIVAYPDGSTATSVIINEATDTVWVWDVGGSAWVDSGTDISGKQDTLVSGTNIKTVNGKNLLGTGNITIESISNTIQISANGSIAANRFIDTGGAQCNNNETSIGVSKSAATDGSNLDVQVFGIAQVEVGSFPVAEGDYVSVAADGKVQSWSDPQKKKGISLDTGFSGNLIRVLLNA
jgi:hypothetical protein